MARAEEAYTKTAADACREIATLAAGTTGGGAGEGWHPPASSPGPTPLAGWMKVCGERV